jgi:hypothetical protein
MRPTFTSLAASDSQCFRRTRLSDSAREILTHYLTAYWTAHSSERGTIMSNASRHRQERGVPLPGESIDSWLRGRHPGPLALFPRLSEYGIVPQFPPTPLLRSQKPERPKAIPRSLLSTKVIFSCELVPPQPGELVALSRLRLCEGFDLTDFSIISVLVC